MFLINSRLGLFIAAPRRFGGEPLHALRHTFFRSYGASLQSSLTIVLSSALGYSPRLPVSVCGTDCVLTPYEAFLGNVRSVTFRARPLVLRLRDRPADLPTDPPTRIQLHPTGVPLTLLRPPFGDNANTQVQ